MFFSWTRPFAWKAFGSANVALVCLQSTSSRWKQQLEGILFTPALSPWSSLHTDATGLCKVSFHTPLRMCFWNRDLWHERALSLFLALVRRLLSPCCVVLWPYVWSSTTAFIPLECGNLVTYVTFWMAKVNRIRWPLNSKFVLTQWLLPWSIIRPWQQSLDMQQIYSFPPHTAIALLPSRPPLLPFIRLFRNILHLSIYPPPRPAPPPTTSGLIMGKLWRAQ